MSIKVKKGPVPGPGPDCAELPSLCLLGALLISPFCLVQLD